MNAITFRSEKELEGFKMSTRKDKSTIKRVDGAEKEVPIETPGESVEVEKTKEIQAKNISVQVKPYKPLVSYPRTLVKARDEHKHEKFLEIVKKFYINIPFLEAITDVPSYAKFLKDILSMKKIT